MLGDLRFQKPCGVHRPVMHGHLSKANSLIKRLRVPIVIGGDQPQPAARGKLRLPAKMLQQRTADSLAPSSRDQDNHLASFGREMIL